MSNPFIFASKDANEFEYTLSATMTLEDWRKVKEAVAEIDLPTRHPAEKLASAIMYLVWEAEKHWGTNGEDDE
jgi:hypothetical protein